MTSDSIVILSHTAALIYLLLLHTAVVTKARRSYLQAPYWLIVISLAVWISSILLNQSGTADVLAFSALIIHYLGACGLAFSVFWFGLTYARSEYIRGWKLFLLSIPIVLIFGLVFFNPWHDSFQIHNDPSGNPFNLLFGLVTLVILFYIAGGWLFALAGVKRKYHDRLPLFLIFTFGFLLPPASSLLYVYGLLNLDFDPAVLTGTLTSTLFAVGAMKFHLLDIMPIARRDIMDEMESVLVIARFDGMVIDCNNAFAKICEEEKRALLGLNLNALITPASNDDTSHLSSLEIFKQTFFAKDNLITEMSLNTRTGQRYFEIMVQPVYVRKKLKGRLYRLTELSRERQLRQLLADQNQQLEAANQTLSKRTQMAADLKRMTIRNQLARELHDQLGHTIIMTLSSLEQIEKLSDENRRWQELSLLMNHVTDQLHKTLPKNEAEESADSLKTSSGKKDSSIMVILSELKQESKKAGVDINIDIQGPASVIPDEHNHQLQQICKEAMTNAIKHGQASQLDYFIKITDSHYELIIVDNGVGNSEFVKGFGLSGMEKRVEELGGSVRFQSDSSGFAVFIKVPLL